MTDSEPRGGDGVMADRPASGDGVRYRQLATELLASADPVTAIADLVGDHEGRLDALAARLVHVEARLAAVALGRRSDG